MFNYFKCVEKRKNNQKLEIAQRSSCNNTIEWAQNFTIIKKNEAFNFNNNFTNFDQTCTFYCDENWEPICDTKGRTHKNLCK